DYVQRLDDDAVYLGHLGEKDPNLNDLWNLEVQHANEVISVVPILSSATDDTVPTVGPALAVDREFPNSIIGRYQVGPFGLGWEWNDGWQRTLSVDSDHNVVITDAYGTPRRFEPDSRGGYFDEPGDHATLTAISGGGFLLTAADGQQTAFAADGAVSYVQDSNGNRVTAAYTGGHLTSLTASTGPSLTFAYNGDRIISVTDSTGRTTHYTYDASNQHLM